MWRDWWMILLSLACAVVVIWLIFAVTLWVVKPDTSTTQDYLRLLPDLLRLLKRLAADPQMPRWIRLALVALLLFVASPIDLIPDGLATLLRLCGLARPAVE